MQVDAPHRSPSPNRTPSATDSNSAPPTKDALPPAADDSELPPLPASDDLSSSHIAPQLTEDSQLGNSDGSALLAPHVKRHLMDIESSFVPDASPSGPSAPHAPAADDTYLFGGSPGRTAHLTKTPAAEGESEEAGSGAGASDKSEPAHRGAEAESDVTTDLSGLPSSPLANAMKRQGRANGDKVNSNTLPTTASRKMHNDDESGTDPLAVSEMGPPPLPKSGRASRRPAFLQNRQASQRSSASSIARSDVSGGTDITLGADYALQSGGAVPTSRSGNGDLSLSRLPSIGSITSLTSSHSDNLPQYHRTRSSTSTTSLAVDTALSRLEEEENSSQPATPRAGSMAAPSDTVIAQHVQNIHVPETVAREYRAKHSSAAGSDDRRQTIGLSYSTRSKHNLTLKEQNSKIDKLSKENFDLKLKIHFLDQALQNRSDEGVMEMISKNVQLQTDLANEKKDNASLRRKIRDLERKLKAQEEESDKKPHPDGDASDDDDEKAEMEEEISYLRETIEQMQTEMVRLKGENFSKEKEKRRLAEYVKAMGEMRPTEPTSGVEETIEMWKDLLQAETARREAADEDAVKLRDEINQLKAEQSATNNMRSVYSMKRQGSVYGARSEAGGSEAPPSRDGTREGGGADSRASTLVVEQLKHENAELRRDLSAQTSMLTSRNRERERLQQEIEDLKIQHRRGGLEAGGGGLGPSAARSIAGDSIFDRSVSRAHVRSSSRASGVTRATGMSEPEREDLERKLGGMRDELAQVKMLNQDLEKALNEQLDAVEAMETENRQLKQEGMLAVEDLQAMQTERDDLLLTIQEKDNDFDTLRAQAVENIDKLEEEYEQKETEFNTLQNDFNALQSEFKTVSENAVRLEDELNASRRKEETLEQQIEEAEREIEELEQKVQDTSAKCERLDVQLENSQNETAFLREEQEGDKIKIGELEGSLATTQTTIEDMLAQAKEERRQRDLIDNKEKAEVQKVLDEINAQAATAKDELRKLRKKLADKEREAETWKERLETLESNLREALGDLNGTRSSLLKDVTKLQRDLEHTLSALEIARQDLSEKDHLLRTRDALLESSGLEAKKLADMLEKERRDRRSDRAAWELMQRSQQSLTRTIQESDTRVSEVEAARQSDRRRFSALENQLREQLNERNTLLLSLWNRLTTLCGPDFVKKNGGMMDTPTTDGLAKAFAPFARNITAAIRALESLMSTFKTRARDLERNITKDFQSLDRALEHRTKRIDHLEKIVHASVARRSASGEHPAAENRSASQASSRSAGREDAGKLRSENKLLRAELQLLRNTPAAVTSPQRAGSGMPRGGPLHRPREGTLARHYSASVAESAAAAATAAAAMTVVTQIPAAPARGHSPVAADPSITVPDGPTVPTGPVSAKGTSPVAGLGIDTGAGYHAPAAAAAIGASPTARRAATMSSASQLRPPSASPPVAGAGGVRAARPGSAGAGATLVPGAPQSSEQRWVYRLKELERRLKAEREARLLDRSGARKRIEDAEAISEGLRLQLEREMGRRVSLEEELGKEAE